MPNPVEVPPGPPPQAAGRGPARFLYTGRLVAEKGLDDLLTAAGLLRGATVELFGEGRLAQALQARVAVPAVAAAVGGIPELVTHGRTGLLVAPGNSTALAAAMAALAGDPGRAAVLERVARQQVAGRHDPGDHAEPCSTAIGG